MSTLARDGNSNAIQVLKVGATQVLTPSDSAVSTAAFGDKTKVVRVVADADMFLTSDGTTATANSCKLPSGVVEYFRVGKGEGLSIYGNGSVYVTEMV